jgi:hypothetical protein
MLLVTTRYYTSRGGRPNNGSANRPRDTISAEEFKAIASGVQANFGTWSVDEGTKMLTWHIEGSMFPNAEDKTSKAPSAFPEMN